MSAQIVDNFKLNVAKPIDSRMVTNGTASRNSLAYIYEGLRVYDLVNKAPYVYIGGSWQQEVSSSGLSVGGGGGGGSSIPAGTQDRLLKYVNSTTVGNSAIVDKGTYLVPNVGIGTSPDAGLALHVNGILKATSFKGSLNGNFIDLGSIDNTKIIAGSEGYSLKTISGQVVWTLSEPLNLNIVITNEIANANIHYLLFSNTSGNATGTPIYANRENASRLIGIKPSTSQILASGDPSNNDTKPTYAFSTNENSGLYGLVSEVGLSFNGVGLLKLNSSGLTIYDINKNWVLSTGTNKVIFKSGEFTGTLDVTGLATVGSLTVNTTSTFNGTINNTTLNVSGTATVKDLVVTGTTKFTSISTGSIIVSGTTKTLDLDVSGITTIPSLTLSGTLTVTGTTSLKDLTISGTTTFNGSIQGGMTLYDLTVMGTLKIGSSYTITSTGIATLDSVIAVDSTGHSNTAVGTITCNRIRLRPTSKTVPISTNSQGYSLGDIIFVMTDTKNGKFWFNNGANVSVDSAGGWSTFNQ